MLSITCRCILYALVSVVVPWGVALGWVRMRLGGEKYTQYTQYTHYKKLDYTTAYWLVPHGTRPIPAMDNPALHGVRSSSATSSERASTSRELVAAHAVLSLHERAPPRDKLK